MFGEADFFMACDQYCSGMFSQLHSPVFSLHNFIVLQRKVPLLLRGIPTEPGFRTTLYGEP